MKLSYKSGQIPTKYELGVGEMAYNVVDGLSYTKMITDDIILVGGPDYLEWVDYNNDAYNVSGSATKLLTVIPKLPLTPQDSAYKLSFVIDNPTNQTAWIYFTIYVDGVAGAVTSYEVIKDTVGKTIELSGILPANYPAGTVFDFYVNDDTGGDMVLRGDTRPTSFIIRKLLPRPIVVG